MALRDWPLHRLVLVWVACALVALLAMLAGSVLDASGAGPASLIAFFLASVSLVAPLILTWHWRRDRQSD